MACRFFFAIENEEDDCPKIIPELLCYNNRFATLA